MFKGRLSSNVPVIDSTIKIYVVDCLVVFTDSHSWYCREFHPDLRLDRISSQKREAKQTFLFLINLQNILYYLALDISEQVASWTYLLMHPMGKSLPILQELETNLQILPLELF